MSSMSYSPTQKLLHWSIFGLVALLYGLSLAEDLFPRGDPGRDLVWWLHISFGLLLAAFVAWRLAVRLSRGAPSLPAAMSGPERLLAHAGHLGLYALLIALPVLGILLTWYRGDALSFFGLFTIPSPVVADRETARSIKGLHELAANGILIVAGLHALAAFWHHWVRRDDVLVRMLPGRRRGVHPAE
ncbi:cytochrome b561 [Tistlia consotensis]|uniref:Cytochrome b561 n=1 Tax=Tistlia consotensis USBA 355 TaxID=560819 RepID=A0A1Y6C343_9PROT|nr:cytochrome b [Tistlia consotensis]SMF33247.1 cytochrome b561 [Tistlia consotensis USBA 355]SNR69546.1 cytochrome b561 [Tistlia consotensis]